MSDNPLMIILKVRTGKTFLPHAARFGKRYYQRRTYNQGIYASAGYYTGSRMSHQGHYYPYGKSRKII